MNSLMLIAAGMAGGLFACLLLRFVWAAVASRMPLPIWRNSNSLSEVLYVGSHALIGGGVGLLFWLSWGFTALAGLTWWQQGLAFGLANSLVFGCLPVVILRSLMVLQGSLYWLLISELLGTCLCAALAASWAWNKAF